jgi:hypothetical protein
MPNFVQIRRKMQKNIDRVISQMLSQLSRIPRIINTIMFGYLIVKFVQTVYKVWEIVIHWFLSVNYEC